MKPFVFAPKVLRPCLAIEGMGLMNMEIDLNSWRENKQQQSGIEGDASETGCPRQAEAAFVLVLDANLRFRCYASKHDVGCLRDEHRQVDPSLESGSGTAKFLASGKISVDQDARTRSLKISQCFGV